jgi:hypothetical protein
MRELCGVIGAGTPMPAAHAEPGPLDEGTPSPA